MLTGPQINDANPIASRMPASLMFTTSVEVPNSAAISGAAGKSEVLEKVAASVIQLAVNRIRIFRHVGHFSDRGTTSSEAEEVAGAPLPVLSGGVILFDGSAGVCSSMMGADLCCFATAAGTVTVDAVTVDMMADMRDCARHAHNVAGHSIGG